MQIPFRAIIVFHAVARAGSISRAADELRVTPSAVSQQIQTLEIHLGTALTLRVGRNIALTEAGERYFQMIGREIEHITDVTCHVRGVRSATTLTVRAAPSVSTKWLVPRLHSFVDANPDIELRLDGTNEPTDFSKENVDIEIRHGEGGWPGLFTETLGKERFYPLCSPSLGAPASFDAADLCEYRLIQSVKSQMQWPRWFAEAGSTGATWQSMPPATASASRSKASCLPGAN
jgi:LysR family glycine cleavage system transcriptional activator